MVKLVGLASFVFALLAAVDVAADPCTSRCTKAYQICAAGRAAGCKAGGAAVGDLAAGALGDALPIPGLGDIFGAAAAELTEAECTKLLLPCAEIRKACLAECLAAGKPSGSSAATPPPQPKKLGTLRIFSDKPNTRVYLNEKRMGATPADPEQPFASPQVPVGHYLVRLMTPDGVWGWEGKGVVEEGNINALEAKLVNLMDKLWHSTNTR